MALTITDHASAHSETSTSTLVVGSVTADVGDMLMLAVAADNNGTSGVASLSTSISDDGGNTWVNRSGLLNRTAGGDASDGTTLGIWTCHVTSALSAANITISFSPDTVAKGALVQKAVSSTGIPPWVYAVGSGVTGSSSTYASGTIAAVPNGYTVIGFIALEASTAPTRDSDTTNGSWTAVTSAIANTGSFFASQLVSSQRKTVNATGDQSWDLSAGGARDYALNWLVISDAAWATTETLSASDAETSALALGAAETETLSGAVASTALMSVVAAEAEALSGSVAQVGIAAIGAAIANALTPSSSAAASIAMEAALEEDLDAELWPQCSDGVALAGTATWLDNLPMPTIAGYAVKPASNVNRTPMEFGDARARRKGTRPLCRVEVGFTITTWQQMLLEGFYRWRAEEGGTWFDVQLAFPLGIRWVSARFTGDVQQQPLGANAWRVTSAIDVLQRPVMSEAALAAILGEEDDPSAPAWPSDPSILPRPTYEGYAFIDHPILARSGNDLPGLPAQRRRSLDRITDSPCRWVLTAAQAATWDGFFVHRALEGARWFSMPVFSGVGLVTASARFTGEASWAPLGGGNWSVEAPMELRERTILTASDLELLEGEEF